MIKQLGTKVYYCMFTGNVLQTIGDMAGYVKETTKEEDAKIYASLQNRDIKTIGLIKFSYGEYPRLSKGSTGSRVNLKTLELEFTFEELPIPPQEPDEIEVLQYRIGILEQENEVLRQELSVTQDAVNELIFNSMSLE